MANLRILFEVANILMKFFATSAIFLLFHTVFFYFIHLLTQLLPPLVE